MPAARDIFSDTMQYVDTAAGSVFKPLNNAQVTVYLAGTTTKATIYQARDPNNNSQVTNPFVTGATGLVEFWAQHGEYDVVVADLNVPARTATKTIGWNSLPGAAGGIGSNALAADAGLPFGALSANAVREVAQIGEVIDWWRPVATIPVPAGWEVCDGRTLAAADHQFPGVAGSVALPDLRNVFILGASTAITDGQAGAATPADGATSAPGIGGRGGTMVRNLSHTHTMAHTHSVSVPGHYHGKGTLNITAGGSHNHTLTDPGHDHAMTTSTTGVTIQNRGTGITLNDPGHAHGTTVSLNGGGNIGVSYIAHGNNSRSGDTSGLVSVHSAGTGMSLTDPQHSHTVTDPQHGHTITPRVTGITLAAATHTHVNGEFSGSVGLTTGSNGDAAIAITSGAGSNETTSSGLSATQDFRPQYVGLLKLMKVRRA